MTLQVFSARVTHSGPDRLDVTRKTGDDWGRTFAPSWQILRPALDARKKADALRSAFKQTSVETYRENAEAIEAKAWEAYVPAFMNIMRRNYQDRRGDWDRLLAMPRVTLVCYCTSERCHRVLLRRDILPKLGAVDCGEVP